FQIGGCTFGGTTIPADASGLLLNVTIVQDAPSGGFVTVFSGDQPGPPHASTVNPATAVAFNFWQTGIPPRGPSAGQLAVFSTNQLALVVDVVGFYAPSNPGTVGNLRFVTPVRLIDTRPTEGNVVTTGFEPGSCAAAITPARLAANATRRF